MSRRRLLRAALAGVSAVGLGGLLGCTDRRASGVSASGEERLETTTIRLVQVPTICQAPQYVVEDLLRSEGFREVVYVRKDGTKGIESALASGEVDLNMHFAAPLVLRIDAGDPTVILAGGHAGCFQLFGTDRVRAIRDLKGRTVAVNELGASQHVFLSSMLAYVGVDPGSEVNFAVHPAQIGKSMLAAGTVDAFLGFPPDAQELQSRQIGHVVVNSTVDRPWSQYFCCMVAGNRQFVQSNPVATKRALRAILKAADACGQDPDWAARTLVEKGYTSNYDYARQALTEIPYGRWREFDAEDTVRFYSLRLQEARMIQANPNTIIEKGTDWRFLQELKRELKA